jgi:hypothetical protein
MEIWMAGLRTSDLGLLFSREIKYKWDLKVTQFADYADVRE